MAKEEKRDTRLPSDYIHYWFSNYVNRHKLSNPSEIYRMASISAENIEKRHIDNLRKEMQRRKIAAFGGNEEDFAKLEGFIELLGNPDFVLNKQASEMANENSSRNFYAKSEWNKVTGGADIASLNATAKAEELADAIEKFCTNLKNALDETAQLIGNKSTMDEYLAEIMREQGVNNNYKYGVTMLRKLLQKNSGRGPFSAKIDIKGNKTLTTSILKVYGLYKSLSVVGVGDTRSSGLRGVSTQRSSSNGSNRPADVVQEIAGIIGGCYSNIAGSSYEVALAHGYNVATEEGLEKINEEISKVLGPGVTIRRSSALAVGEKPEKDSRGKDIISKSDVVITMDVNNVTVSYGISAKKYKPVMGDAGTREIKMVTDTALFYDWFKRVVDDSNKNVIYNMLAGHREGESDKIELGDGAKTRKRIKGNLFGSRQADNGWRELVKTIIAANFVEVVAGTIGKGSDNPMFIATPDNLIPIADVIDSFISKITSESGKEILAKGTVHTGGENSTLINSKSFRSANKWVAGGRAIDSRIARSNDTNDSINSLLTGSTITVTTRMLNEFLRAGA